MTGQQLKNSILQLAIQGKLVPQDPNDEPASVLLQRIRKEKEQLVKEGKLKKKDLISEPIAEDEKPFDIPESWEWVSLQEISLDSSDGPFGSNLKREHYTDNKEVRIIQLSNIGESGWKDANTKYTTFAHLPNIARSEAFAGDIIIAKMMPAGRAIVCPDIEKKYVLSSDAVRFDFSKEIFRRYLLYAINSRVFLNQVYGEVQGITRVRTSLNKLRTYLLPLPPLSEQQRIVAKIEELMPLVEDYDKAQKELNDLNEKLPEQLKKSILQQAIMGKLVPQDPADEPASVLLQRIRKEKEQLVKEGKLKKKDLETTPIADDEKPFDIPESWEWVRISELSIVVTKGTTPRGGNIAYVDSGIGFLRAENVAGMDVLDLTNLKYVTETTHHTFLSRSVLHARDILITIAGTLGRTAIVKQENLPLNANQAVCLIRPLKVVQNLRYIITALNAPVIQDSLLGFTKTTAIPNLTLEIISNCVLPLPPLSEQHRIVAKIEELFALLK